MANNGGWIKLHRQIRESAVWQDPLRLKAWIDILLRANHKDNEVFIKGKAITVKKGQCIASGRTLAEEWGCCEKTVRKILSQFEEFGMISVEIHPKRYAVLTVIKYSDFQEGVRTEFRTEVGTEVGTEFRTEYSTEFPQTRIYKNDIRMNKNEKEEAPPRLGYGGRIIEE